MINVERSLQLLFFHDNSNNNIDNCIDGLAKAYADNDLCSGGSVDENVYDSFSSD